MVPIRVAASGERHRAGASCAGSGRDRPGSVVGVCVNGWRIATLPGGESWSLNRRLVIEKQASDVDLVVGGPGNGINRFAHPDKDVGDFKSWSRSFELDPIRGTTRG